jgi:MFS transporter, AAHS family, 3-hydroxyphenylpropionic acid transporter
MAELRTLRVVFFCFLVIFMEGFDIQAAGVAAPRLARDYALGPAQLGLFFSASAVGVLLFSIVGGILADRFGRKWVVVGSTFAFGLACLLTPICPDINSLVFVRFLTGAGLGAAMPVVIAMTSDHSPPERKKRYVGIVYCAISLGGACAAILSASPPFGADWRPVFYVGGILPMIIAITMAAWLPESRSRRRDGAPVADTGSWQDIIGLRNLPMTLALWIATFGTLTIMYLLVNWMPSMLDARGIHAADAALVQTQYNIGSTLAALLTGYLLDRKMIFSVPIVGYVILAGALTSVSVLPIDLTVGTVIGFMLGAGVTTGQTLLYAFAPLCYPAGVRNRGVGCAVAAGRLGTIFGPLFAGLLLSAGLTSAQVMLALLPIVGVTLATALAVSYCVSRPDADMAAQTASP